MDDVSTTGHGDPADGLSHIGSIARASELVAQQLRRLIVSGQIVSGGSLEPTTQLMKRFGVSRPTLREAFRILESENLVSVQRGSRSGVRVLEPSIGAAARVTGQTLQATGATIGDLYVFQLAVEPFATRLLAERRDPEDVRQLQLHLDKLIETARTGDDIPHAVQLARFHTLVVELTGNKVLALTTGMIADLIERHQENSAGVIRDIRLSDEAKVEFRSVGIRSIRKLIRLIGNGNAEEAEAHWRRHVQRSNSYWLGLQDQFTPVRVVD